MWVSYNFQDIWLVTKDTDQLVAILQEYYDEQTSLNLKELLPDCIEDKYLWHERRLNLILDPAMVFV